jgi:hypothetical protein
MVVGFTGLNPAYGEVYLIQHLVIKFITDSWQVSDFSGYSISSTNKTDCHNINEILA